MGYRNSNVTADTVGNWTQEERIKGGYHVGQGRGSRRVRVRRLKQRGVPEGEIRRNERILVLPVDERLRQSRCGNKIRHKNKRAAQLAQIASAEAFGVSMDVYECEFCSRWHLGGEDGSED